MLTLSEIWVYPVKSLSGVKLDKAKALEKGLEYDRRMMLVDNRNQFITQRQYPELALYKISLTATEIIVHFKNDAISVPMFLSKTKLELCTVWASEVVVFEISPSVSKWFSDRLGFTCRLVCFPEANNRNIEPPYPQQLSLADAFPVLLIGQASLDDLNHRMSTPMPMNRFRPNLVFTGGLAFEEDKWGHFKIGLSEFMAARPSYRCIVTTTDQDTGLRGREPLLTLSKYRRTGDKILFGMNTLVTNPGMIEVGQKIVNNT